MLCRESREVNKAEAVTLCNGVKDTCPPTNCTGSLNNRNHNKNWKFYPFRYFTVEWNKRGRANMNMQWEKKKWFLLPGKREGAFLGRRRRRGKSIELSGARRSTREEGSGGRGSYLEGFYCRIGRHRHLFVQLCNTFSHFALETEGRKELPYMLGLIKWFSVHNQNGPFVKKRL